MRNDICHPERAQILSERSESKDRHQTASWNLHLTGDVRADPSTSLGMTRTMYSLGMTKAGAGYA